MFIQLSINQTFKKKINKNKEHQRIIGIYPKCVEKFTLNAQRNTNKKINKQKKYTKNNKQKNTFESFSR